MKDEIPHFINGLPTAVHLRLITEMAQRRIKEARARRKAFITCGLLFAASVCVLLLTESPRG